MFFRPDDLNWQTPGCPDCSLTFIVLLTAANWILRHPNVKGSIGAAKNVAVVHEFGPAPRQARDKVLQDETFGGGGSRRRFMPALSAAEGNPRSTPLFSRGSSVSVGSRVFALRKANRVFPSRRSQLANAWMSRLLPYLHCVLGNGEPDLAPFQRKRIDRRSEECSSSTLIRPCPSTSSGQSFARRKVWRRGESNPRPKSATARSLHAYRIRFGSPATLGTRKTRRRLVRLISPDNHGPRSAGQPTV